MPRNGTVGRAMSASGQFTPGELKQIAQRAFTLAKQADEPAVRIALGLFGESAENLAKRLPDGQPPAAAEPASGDVS